MTIVRDTPAAGFVTGPGTSEGTVNDRPAPRKRPAQGEILEGVGCLGASLAVVVIIFELAGTHPPLGIFLCWALSFIALYGVLTYLLHGVLVAKDRLATVCIWFLASLALLPLAEILITVAHNGAPVVFAHFPAFLVHDMATAGAKDPVWKGGMGHAIIGTVEQVGLATLYTVPISVMTATYLSETSSTFSRLVRTIVDCMMGTPSIIAGLFVYIFWVYPRHTNGFSGFAASIALAILMLPIMIRTAEEVIRVVPGSLREAALALGAPRWKVSLRIVLPTVRSGILTAVILGVALAVGETAPTLLTAGGTGHFNANPFHGVQANLPLQAFQLIQLSSPVYVRDAWGGAFILVFMVLTLFVLARLLGSARPGGRRITLRRRRSKEVAVP
jgi:phosphate transport system permease protein